MFEELTKEMNQIAGQLVTLSIVQEDKTGCRVASPSALAGVSYKEAMRVANKIGIRVEDQSLWPDSQYVKN